MNMPMQVNVFEDVSQVGCLGSRCFKKAPVNRTKVRERKKSRPMHTGLSDFIKLITGLDYDNLTYICLHEICVASAINSFISLMCRMCQHEKATAFARLIFVQAIANK